MNTTSVQELSEELLARERDRRRVTEGILSAQLLSEQNTLFQDGAGVSANNRDTGFLPAFLDHASGSAVVSRFADGRPAPLHLLDGLPEAWVLERDGQGHVLRACPGVVAGFLRAGRFYTREEAARALSH